MWMGAPKTYREYLDRSIYVPWIATGLAAVLVAGLLIILLVFERDPTSGFGPAEPRDKWIVGGVAVLALVIALIIAPFKTRSALILRDRGVRTRGQLVSISALAKNGQRPVTIAYRVDGKTMKLKRDMPVDEVKEMNEKPFFVLYDPQKPSRTHIITPDMAALPDATA